MAVNESITQVFYPRNWGELIPLLYEDQPFHLYTGESLNPQWKTNRLELSNRVISVEYLEDFHNISRTDRYVEAGTAVSLQRFLNKAKNILPLPLIHLLEKKYTLPRRYGLTLGSLLAPQDKKEDIHLLLYLLDCLVEERIPVRRSLKSLSSHWSYFSQLNHKKEQPIWTSMRLPLISWEQYLIRKIRFPQGELDMIVLTDTSRGYVSDFRMAFLYPPKGILRNQEWEDTILGRKDFFHPKEREQIYDFLIDNGVPHDPDFLEPAIMTILTNFLYHFLDTGY